LIGRLREARPVRIRSAGEELMENLKDKIAVITGGGGGIGRSIALALADEGGHLVIADIQEGLAAAVAEEARARGVRAISVACDVAQHAQVGALAEAAYAEFGAVDILCNNAGVSWRPYRGALDATLDDWRFILGVNLWGVIHGLDVFLPRMRRQPGEKHIVNTASLGGLVPLEGHAPYSSSKSAVIGLSEAMAGELAPHGFGVTILCPGPIPTNLGENCARLRGELAGATERRFEPLATPMMERLATFTMPSVDPVGAMVCRAIRAGTLYMHTAAVPGDLVADRLHTWFGSQTLV
jgi:NAD(P)-dependent dehydrogenase (short-subunit alcohol dehydrogenase family)